MYILHAILLGPKHYSYRVLEFAFGFSPVDSGAMIYVTSFPHLCAFPTKEIYLESIELYYLNK
jgi:hypothetical protein